MRCTWCGLGEGKEMVKDRKTGLTYFYYCLKCACRLEVKEEKGP